MNTMISRIGLLPTLLLGLPAWADSSASEWGFNQMLWVLLVLAGVGGVLFWLGRRRKAPVALAGAFPQAVIMPPSAEEPQAPAKTNRSRTNATYVTSFLPAATVTVEEVSRIEEEAEVYLLLGRMDLAIGALRHYIESSADAPAHVWMSLLDVLHAQGLRQEFEKLAPEIRERFNVALPTWEDANARCSGMTGLERFPHLFARIAGQWRDPQCIDYLRSLLQDNRNGERGGFHMEAFRDLLFLIGILEQAADSQ